MIGVSDHTVLLWVLLPVVVLISGMAPSMISFAAGQAGFTLVVIILFNIIAAHRLESRPHADRGRGHRLRCQHRRGPLVLAAGRRRRRLGRRSPTSFVGQLRLPGRRRREADIDTPARGHRRQPASLAPCLSAARRRVPPVLHRARGKVVSMDTISRLFTGSNRLRLAAFTPGHVARPPSGGRPTRGRVRRHRRGRPAGLLRVRAIAGTRSSPTFWPTAGLCCPDRRRMLRSCNDVLRKAFEDVRDQQRSDRVQTTQQMLWADELLESQSDVQKDLQASADLFFGASAADFSSRDAQPNLRLRRPDVCPARNCTNFRASWFAIRCHWSVQSAARRESGRREGVDGLQVHLYKAGRVRRRPPSLRADRRSPSSVRWVRVRRPRPRPRSSRSRQRPQPRRPRRPRPPQPRRPRRPSRRRRQQQPCPHPHRWHLRRRPRRPHHSMSSINPTSMRCHRTSWRCMAPACSTRPAAESPVSGLLRTCRAS